MFDINKSYWNHNGRYQDKLDELIAAGVQVPGGRTYYRYYNDGDKPRGIKNFPGIFASADICDAFLEDWMDKKILQAYLKFKKKTSK